MKRSKLIALLCFLTMLSCKENKTDAQGLTKENVISEKISTDDFKEKIEKQKVQLIDVRTPKEYKEGYIENAENINFFDADFFTQMNKLNKDEPVYIYCRSGNRSGKAARKLKELGFKEIYDLQGGILTWQKNNLELVK